jgi:hypothetical protein
MVPSPPPLPMYLPVITLFPLVPPLLICWLSGFLVPQPLPLVAPLPGTLPPPFITPPPFVVPLLFGWLSLCLAPRPCPLVAIPPGATSRHTALVRLICRIARRLGLSYRWLSYCLSSLPPVRLRLLFVTAFVIVCRCFCRHIHPARCLLSQNGSGASPHITIFVIVAVRVRRQRGASPTISVITRTRCQGVAPRRE